MRLYVSGHIVSFRVKLVLVLVDVYSGTNIGVSTRCAKEGCCCSTASSVSSRYIFSTCISIHRNEIPPFLIAMRDSLSVVTLIRLEA